MTEQTKPVEIPFQRRPSQSVVVLAAIGLTTFFFAAGFPASPSPRSSPGPPTDSESTWPSLQLDLNSADEKELSLTPGIGEVLAQRIVENRRRLGPFSRLEDVTRVHGVGEKTLAEIARIFIVEQTDQQGEFDDNSAPTRLASTKP